MILCIDLGNIPSDLCERMLRENTGLRLFAQRSGVYSKMTVCHRNQTDSLRELVRPVLRTCKEHEMTTIWRGAYGLEKRLRPCQLLLTTHQLQSQDIDIFEEYDQAYHTPRLAIAADRDTVSRVVGELESYENNSFVYLHLDGFTDLSRFSTCTATDGVQSNTHTPFDSNTTCDDPYFVVARGWVPSFDDDPRQAPKSMSRDNVSMAGTSSHRVEGLRLSRKLHLRDIGGSDVGTGVVQAQQLRHVAVAISAALSDTLTYLHEGLDNAGVFSMAHVFVYSSGVMNMCAHNGTHGDPWDTRSFCMTHFPGQTHASTTDSPIDVNDLIQMLCAAARGQVDSLPPTLTQTRDARLCPQQTLGLSRRYMECCILSTTARPAVFFVHYALSVDSYEYEVTIWIRPSVDTHNSLCSTGSAVVSHPLAVAESIEDIQKAGPVQVFNRSIDPDRLTNLATNTRWLQHSHSTLIVRSLAAYVVKRGFSSLTLQSIGTLKRDSLLYSLPPSIQELHRGDDIEPPVTLFLPLGTKQAWTEWVPKPLDGCYTMRMLALAADTNAQLLQKDGICASVCRNPHNNILVGSAMVLEVSACVHGVVFVKVVRTRATALTSTASR